uniref:Protein kinase domain-containing protein n=1 Tax=Leersia perrieri TaxID=77586 RepID=A0A0D9XBN8_9ORYZ
MSMVIAVVLLLLLPNLAVQAVWQVCDFAGGNYTANGTYHANLQLLSSTLPAIFFATARVDVGGAVPRLYTMAQCTPDMSSSGDCWRCLQDAIGNKSRNEKVPAAAQGARVFGVRCGYRYEVYPFYAGEPMLVGSPGRPLLPKSSEKEQEMDHCLGSSYAISVSWPYILLLVENKAEKTEIKIAGASVRNLIREDTLEHWGMKENNSEFNLFDFSQLSMATRNFADENMIGQGSFGTVYKGELPNRLEIAVKRLDKHSGQGLPEFKNEIQLIAKLQHSNLVSILGCCVQGIYKKSRIINMEETPTHNRRDITSGYMSPEYASKGIFSLKSDVYSFGVLLLEIVCGKRNSASDQYGDFFNLGWQFWKDEKWIELVDPSLVNEGQLLETEKCFKIGLLCVQENAVDRPTMSDIVTMLSSETMSLPEPKQPAYFNLRSTDNMQPSSSSNPSTGNEVTIFFFLRNDEVTISVVEGR